MTSKKLTISGTESISETATPPLVFHDKYNTKRPGDVILQSGDEPPICFYFRLAQLSELSSFFSSLPPPSDKDLIDGTPLIPLHDSTSLGLIILLGAIRSTLTTETYDMFEEIETDSEAQILEAIIIAKIYDVPLAFRLLYDTVNLGEGDSDPYLVFALWAVAGVESKIADAALQTTGKEGLEIAFVDRYISDFGKLHAPAHWFRLLELHARRTVAPPIFLQKVKGTDISSYTTLHQKGFPAYKSCPEGNQGSILQQVQKSFSKITTLNEIEKYIFSNFGLGCGYCQADVRTAWVEALNWLRDYTRKYK